MEVTKKRPWSDLPPELLSLIGMRLHTRMDVLRFRSVCSSFRSSVPPLPHDALRLPFRLPRLRRSALFLHESTVYAVETPDGSASSRAQWLLKLEESELGHRRILSLFSQRRILNMPGKFPKVLDSLQVRIVEICREYTFGYGGRSGGLVQGIQKVVTHPDCVWSDLNRCWVYFIDEGGQLGYCKYGDEDWSYLDDPHRFDDIVVYEGKVCVVDQFGSVSQIDSSFRLRSFSMPIYGDGLRSCSGSRKDLVVSSDGLYVVDRDIRQCGRPESDPLCNENMWTSDFRVYRLDRQCGRWEEVRSLGNSAFFLCKLCSFAVSARELGGCDGNCIYYAEDAYSYCSPEKVRVYSLADRSIKWLDFSDFVLGMTTASNPSKLKPTLPTTTTPCGPEMCTRK
ncbi:putative F-box protein At5g60060 [Rhodamnia argentea]|uniref:F-box protein At5g60060 n=1 Tax=Rhodamnia argentea TaxID=178133 RepID=A0A8B8PM55_9MYRT|nr:putative F-box protein At5g60060 [Rhodamnia argentea]